MKRQSLIDQGQLDGKIKVLADVRNPDICMSTRLSPDGKYFAVSLASGKVHLFSVKNDKLIYKLDNENKTNNYSSTAVRFRPWGFQNLTPNNILISTFTDGSVKTYHFPSLACVHKLNEGTEVLTCEYSKFGDTFATSGSDGILRIYDDETRQLLVNYAPPFYENARFRRMYSIAYHPINTDEIITGGWDDVIRYYDLRIHQQIKQIYGPHICGEGLDFSPSGREFCSASWRRHDSVQIWDYGSSKAIKTFADQSQSENIKPKKKVIPSTLNYCCKYLCENKILIGGSLDDALTVMDCLTGEVLVTIKGLQKSVYSVDCYQSKVVFVAGNYVSLIRLFR